MSGKGDRYVTVSKEGTRALGGPQFLVRHGKKYYLTVAVWEYDPQAADTDEEKRSVAEVQAVFKNSKPDPDCEVRCLKSAAEFGQATNPDQN